jgi:hypothetical protein
MNQTARLQALSTVLTRPLQNKRGAYIEELAALLACVVVVAMVMAGYFRDSVRGMARWAEILCNTLSGGGGTFP